VTAELWLCLAAYAAFAFWILELLCGGTDA
jgi:hypothetical protein